MSDDDARTAAGLRAESDQFHAHLDRLVELEDEKRELSPIDPAFVALAQEIEQLAATVLADAHGQTEVGEAAHRDGVVTPIVEVPDDATEAEILSRWRAAERQLAAAASADEARQLRATIEAYRRAYQTLFEQLRNRDR